MDEQRVRALYRGDDMEDSDDDGEDIEGFETFDASALFLTEFGKGISGGGNKTTDSIVPNK